MLFNIHLSNLLLVLLDTTTCVSVLLPSVAGKIESEMMHSRSNVTLITELSVDM